MADMTSNYDFRVRTGETTAVSLAIDIEGVPMNLSGYDAVLVVKKDPSTPVLLKLEAPAEITLGGADGSVELKFVVEDLSGEFRYQLDLISPSGDHLPLLFGAFNVWKGLI